MYSFDMYSYIPRYTAYLLSDSFQRRFNIVYSNPIKLHRNVDNKIQFKIYNQDQKPVNIASDILIFRLFNLDGDIFLERQITNFLPVNGLATITIYRDDINVTSQRCHYSLTKKVGNEEYPLFVDGNNAATGQVEILDSVKPKFIPSTIISIPDHTPQVIDILNTFYSSAYITDYSNNTLQVSLDTYTGKVSIFGSVDNIDWYPIVDFTETAYTGSKINYIEGFHPYLRYKFEATNGLVGTILAR